MCKRGTGMRRRTFLSLLAGGALAWPKALEALAEEFQEGGGAHGRGVLELRPGTVPHPS